MPINIDYSNLASPQMGAITGGRQYIPREDYVREMAQFLPAIKASDREYELQELSAKREADALAEARRQRNIGMGIEAGNIALQSGAVKPISSAIKNMYTTPFTATGTSTGTTYATAGFGSAPSIPASGFDSVGAGAISPQAVTTGATQAANPIATTVANIGAGLVGTGAGAVVGRSNFGEWANKQGIMGEREADVAGGALAGALSGAAYGSVIPGIGTVAGAVFGGISGGLKNAKCIIVTACTDPDSYEVNIAREYRDKFMDDTAKRGYYMIAERIVPRIASHESYKKYIKETLVDKLIDYGEVMLGKKEQCEYADSELVSASFLLTCKQIGLSCKSFTRSNGEVV